MSLPRNTFVTSRQYSKDSITQYFADVDEIDDTIWHNGKPAIEVRCDGTTWLFAQNRHGKYTLVEIIDS